jgi:hypothetical protein
VWFDRNNERSEVIPGLNSARIYVPDGKTVANGGGFWHFQAEDQRNNERSEGIPGFKSACPSQADGKQKTAPAVSGSWVLAFSGGGPKEHTEVVRSALPGISWRPLKLAVTISYLLIQRPISAPDWDNPN